MTVQQLIEKLQEMPQDLVVVNESCSQEVEIVELTQTVLYIGDGKKIVHYVGIV